MVALTELYDAWEEAYGFQDWWPADSAFEVAVGAILTQNTSWRNVERAVENMKNEGLLSPEKIKTSPLPTIKRPIRPAGYYNAKALKLKSFVEFLFNRYDGDIEAMKTEDKESLRSELLGVWGVGPETADSILCYALEKESFVVDAYTKRILSRMGYLEESMSYADVKSYIEERIPQDLSYHQEFHALFVAHAKAACTARDPRCETCPVATACQFATGRTSSQAKPPSR